jgi:hypothetical protein
VHEEDAVDAKAMPPSAVSSLAPTVSTVDTDDALEGGGGGVQDDSNGGRTPDRVQGDCSNGGDEAVFP